MRTPRTNWTTLSAALLLVGCHAALGCQSALDEDFSRNTTNLREAGAATDEAHESDGDGDTGTTEPEGHESDALSSGPETPEQPAVNQCSDGAKNGVETSTDCGGGTCAACGLGLACIEHDDCQSGVCLGECIAAGCTNEFQDDNESDQDCGGTCSPCDDGLRCNGEADCKSGVCGQDGRCAVASCSDGVRNGVETGTDCGHESECGGCAEGQRCEQARDCADGACVANMCVPARCADGLPNGSETDVDCGGDCPACKDGQSCDVSTDCENRRCEDDGAGELVCLPPACDDRVLNGDETDIDCGGSCDARCGEGERCEEAEDCAERVCRRDDEDEFRICKAPTCRDEVRNGTETAIDCGGECGPCDVGDTCEQHTDCLSNSCDDVCLEASCEDERLNQGEADVDCGGEACEPCGVGADCVLPGDCTSGFCEDSTCTGNGAGAECVEASECLSSLCDETCELGGAESECRSDGDCLSFSCVDDTCALSTVANDCRSDDDCVSARCVSGECEPGSIGATCGSGPGCASDICDDGTCAPLDLRITSEGIPEQEMMIVHFEISAGSVDIDWDEIAVLYFFEPEVRNNLQTAYESLASASRLCVDMGNDQWAYVWRNAATGTIAQTATAYIAQVHDESWTPMVNANDHSHESMAGANRNIVICRLVQGTWRHVQGNIPPGVADPCSQVEPDCGAVTCDDPAE